MSTLNGREAERARIEELLNKKDLPGLLGFLAGLSIPDLADLLMLLNPSARVAVFRLLPKAVSSEVFAYLNPSHMNTLLRDLTDQETQHLLANMRPDDRTALFEELPGQAIQRLLNLLIR